MKLRSKITVAIFFLLPALSLFAQDQKEVKKQKMVWYSFSEDITIRKKWHIEAEFEERHFIDSLQQAEMKAGVSGLRDINKNWNAGIGVSYAREGFDEFILPEFRIEQEFNNRQKFNWFAVSNRYKIEERFFRIKENGEIPDNYNFAMRFRYRLSLDFTLAKFGEKKNPLKLRLNDEVMINAGKQFVRNIFDQNRFYAGFSYSPFKNFAIGVGYMNVFKQRKSGYKYYDKHIIRFSIEHELSFKKKKKKDANPEKI